MRKRDERGMVSFLITMIMMIVISLIVIGFTQVANRNRRETLDRQLSTQAFYAAESGVNDAINTIKSAAGSIPAQNSCAGTDYPPANLNGTAVRYTCVLVDPLPDDLMLSANTQSSTIIPINTTDDAGLAQTATRLTFSWSAQDSTTPSRVSCPNLPGDFPENASYLCGFPLLRVDLFKTDGVPGFTPTDFNTNTTTLFLQAVRTPTLGPSISGFATKANIFGADCDDITKTCSLSLAINGAAQGQHYYARLTSLYADAQSVTIAAQTASGPASFKDAQAVVDVTGKAQDVLRRVQVRVPLKEFADSGNAAVYSSGDVCKRFSVYSGSLTPECT